MERTRIAIGFAVVLVIGLGLSSLGCQSQGPSAAGVCSACRRPIHAHSLTVARFGDRQEAFCCPACALSVRLQTKDPVKIVELSDYRTGAKLRPEQAYVVRGSDVNMCARQQPLIDENKEPHPVQYDRCSPGILAFGTKDAAVRFSENHGGTFMRFDELAASFAKQ